MTDAVDARPADLPAESGASRRIGIVAIVCVLAAGALRLISPLQQYARSGGRDVVDLWIGLAAPLAIIAILGVLLLVRLSPSRRARILRAAHPSGAIATGYWAHETSGALLGAPDRGQLSTFTLVVDAAGVQLHSGSMRSAGFVNIHASGITWVHSGVA